jgi:chaperonin GroEL
MSNEYLPDAVFEDIAAFVDAKYIDLHPRGGLKVSDIKIGNCGLVKKFVATTKGSVFYGGNGTLLNAVKETTRVQARILQLRAELEEEKDILARKNIERRIAEFSGGKATIHVDAKTASERFYLKLKAQDCVNSCQTALDSGMVRGGGLSYEEVAKELGEDSLLYTALMEPARRIRQNAGGSLIIGEDVMDSYLVAEAGIRYAVSGVKVIITIEGIIADHPQSMVEDLGKALSTVD